MKMGIERVLKEKFGDAVKDIRQVYDEEVEGTTVEVSFIPSPMPFIVHGSIFWCPRHMLADSNKRYELNFIDNDIYRKKIAGGKWSS